MNPLCDLDTLVLVGRSRMCHFVNVYLVNVKMVQWLSGECSSVLSTGSWSWTLQFVLNKEMSTQEYPLVLKETAVIHTVVQPQYRILHHEKEVIFQKLNATYNYSLPDVRLPCFNNPVLYCILQYFIYTTLNVELDFFL